MPAQNACDLLDADHQKVEKLFSEYQAAGDAAKPALAQQVCMELLVHMTIEDEIFYPAFRQATKDEAMVDEAEEEHEEAKDLIAEIEDAEEPGPLMAELQKAIEHHVDEERKEMFPKARKAQGLDLMELGAQLQARKAELMASTSE